MSTAPNRKVMVSLAMIFGASTLALVALLAVLGFVGRRFAQEAVVSAASERISQRGKLLAERVDRFLLQGDLVIRELERDIQAGVLTLSERGTERALYSRVLNNDNLVEVSYTAATGDTFQDDGRRILDEARSQIAVFRMRDGSVWSRRTLQKDGAFTRETRRRPAGHVALDAVSFTPDADAPVADPTEHLTFSTPARRGIGLVRSDLHWSQLDDGQDTRRVVVTSQKAIFDRDGHFRGVLRVATSASRLSENLGTLSEDFRSLEAMAAICDKRGRLIAFEGSANVFQETDGDLRAPPDGRGQNVTEMLRGLKLSQLLGAQGSVDTRVSVHGKTQLLSLHSIPLSQDWVVLLAIPQTVLLADLNRRVDTSLLIGSAVVLIILVGGVMTLTMIRGALRSIDRRTGQIEAFEFEPAPPGSRIRDVASVLRRLELAKTAMRAMGHYVPIELVKRIYRSGREPSLGGEEKTITILFSDIAGFTTISEQLDPNRLAHALGLYLESATERVHEYGGIVDKYIGDAVMGLWNAPEDVEDHAVKACLTALACRRANAELFASPKWADTPPFPTRYGIHRGEVIVGHFGSPQRMSYTAIGDGVNLAARLEGLNKVYGTEILISEAVRSQLPADFLVRRIDLVAVKGRKAPTAIYELLGHAAELTDDERDALTQKARAYEAALNLYLDGRFEESESCFAALSDDEAAAMMAARCRGYHRMPPSEAWDGVWRARTK